MNNELKAYLGADRAIKQQCTVGSDRLYAIFSTPQIIQLGGKPEDSRSRVAKDLQSRQGGTAAPSAPCLWSPPAFATIGLSSPL
jgi:hypothetical protein